MAIGNGGRGQLQHGLGLVQHPTDVRRALDLVWSFFQNQPAGILEPDEYATIGKLVVKLKVSWAAGQGHEAVARLLVDKGADPDSEDSGGRTPLSWATGRGHEAVVQLLLATVGVDSDSKNSDEQTPLSWAAGQGHEVVVRLLLATNGVNLRARSLHGAAVLMGSTSLGARPPCALAALTALQSSWAPRS